MDQKNSTNRRRSFKRRRLEAFNYIGVTAIAIVLLHNVATTESVPMDSDSMRIHKLTFAPLRLWHHHRVTRDAVNAAGMLSNTLAQQHDGVKDISMQGSSTELLTDQQLQGQCLLDGEYVPETTVFCEKHDGCRAIQKTGHCCPDYKCDCQKDGKTYLNGDKLVDPNTPCTVCYCQGGEILCSSVTCFHRDDCTPQYVMGVCCPHYDNCPVVSADSPHNKNITTTSTTPKAEIPSEVDDQPKITIKEITKPTEIRITGDKKAKPNFQMFKPSTATTTTSATIPSMTMPATESTPTILPSTGMSPIPTVATTTSTIHSIAPPSTTVDAITKVNSKNEKLNEMTAATPSSDNNHKKNIYKSGEILKLSASVVYPQPSTSGPLEESNAAGDDLVPALTAFSTQGLPEDPSKVNIKREYFITTEGVQSVVPQQYDASGEYSSGELIYVGGSPGGASAVGQQSLKGFQQSSAELDADTAGSDNIYHIILTTDGPRLSTTSENYLALKASSSTEGSHFEELSSDSVSSAFSSSSLLNNDIVATTEGPEPLSTTTSSTTTDGDGFNIKSSTESMSHQHMDEDESEIPIESNPAYPSLPGEDFSIRGENIFQLSDNDEVAEESRSIGNTGTTGGSDLIKTTKHLSDSVYGGESGSGGGSGGGGGSDILVEELVTFGSTTEGSGGIDLSTKLSNYEMKKVKAPQFMQLMYSAEDSSEETKFTNSTEFQMENGKKSKDSSLESIEVSQPSDGLMAGLECGSGSGAATVEPKLKKQREPTTPKPYKGGSISVDIDDFHNESSGNGPEEDPKEDAESLKLDDGTSDYRVQNSEKSSKGNILSVNAALD